MRWLRSSMRIAFYVYALSPAPCRVRYLGNPNPIVTPRSRRAPLAQATPGDPTLDWRHTQLLRLVIHVELRPHTTRDSDGSH